MLPVVGLLLTRPWVPGATLDVILNLYSIFGRLMGYTARRLSTTPFDIYQYFARFAVSSSESRNHINTYTHIIIHRATLRVAFRTACMYIHTRTERRLLIKLLHGPAVYKRRYKCTRRRIYTVLRCSRVIIARYNTQRVKV